MQGEATHLNQNHCSSDIAHRHYDECEGDWSGIQQRRVRRDQGGTRGAGVRYDMADPSDNPKYQDKEQKDESSSERLAPAEDDIDASWGGTPYGQSVVGRHGWVTVAGKPRSLRRL